MEDIRGIVVFLSTPSARRATIEIIMDGSGSKISIHALCEEGDVVADRHLARGRDISIHALCEEGDLPVCPAVFCRI